MAEDLKPQQDDDTEGRGRKMDPELRVLGLLLREIEELDASARSRVVAFLSHRYYDRGVK